MFRIRLKELREQKGLNQREFAKALNISPSTVGMWESGEREPKNLALLKSIADYFGVTVDALLDDKKAMEKPTPVKEGGQVPGYDKLTPANQEQARRYIAFLIAEQQKD